MKKIQKLLLVGIIVPWSLSVYAAGPNELLKEGSRHWEKQAPNFQESATESQKVVEEKSENIEIKTIEVVDIDLDSDDPFNLRGGKPRTEEKEGIATNSPIRDVVGNGEAMRKHTKQFFDNLMIDYEKAIEEENTSICSKKEEQSGDNIDKDDEPLECMCSEPNMHLGTGEGSSAYSPELLERIDFLRPYALLMLFAIARMSQKPLDI